jgi:hypothetical protein
MLRDAKKSLLSKLNKTKERKGKGKRIKATFLKEKKKLYPNNQQNQG